VCTNIRWVFDRLGAVTTFCALVGKVVNVCHVIFEVFRFCECFFAKVASVGIVSPWVPCGGIRAGGAFALTGDGGVGGPGGLLLRGKVAGVTFRASRPEGLTLVFRSCVTLQSTGGERLEVTVIT
jgi:hypothetical protein